MKMLQAKTRELVSPAGDKKQTYKQAERGERERSQGAAAKEAKVLVDCPANVCLKPRESEHAYYRNNRDDNRKSAHDFPLHFFIKFHHVKIVAQI